jgi:CspA family cold shock protein
MKPAAPMPSTISAVHAAGMDSLEKEQRISYELEKDARGKSSAANLKAA